jgi:hypothetical protein
LILSYGKDLISKVSIGLECIDDGFDHIHLDLLQIVSLVLCLFRITRNPEFHSGLIPIVPSAHNEIRIPITVLAISEHLDYAILPKAIPVKALNTAKRNSGLFDIDV